jgi:endoglycosylceramidase
VADYQRMKAVGANVQSIRLGLGSPGFGHSGAATAGYVERVQSMVNLAKQAGIYTVFKMTAYDARPLAGNAAAQGWADLWQDSLGYQGEILGTWHNLWTPFKVEPAVVGYDLLNEPEKGNLGVSDSDFLTQYVNPFYQRATDDLRKTDPNRALC